ncbi:MAG: hypothetical protein AABW64_04020 [Nanoarchaeota archaeon]
MTKVFEFIDKMKGNLQIYYDEEGDFLEINPGEYTEGYFRDVSEGIASELIRKQEKPQE